MPNTDTYTTTDMTLASFLIYRGHDPAETEVIRSGHDRLSVAWRFDAEAVAGEVEDYEAGLALAEPRELGRIHGQVKRAMFAQLDQAKRVRA